MIEEGAEWLYALPQESKVEPNIRWKFHEEDTKHVALYSLPVNPQIFRKESLLVDIRENGIFFFRLVDFFYGL